MRTPADILMGGSKAWRDVLRPDQRQICFRCKKNPIDPALLGAEGEGHICGDCWTLERTLGGD